MRSRPPAVASDPSASLLPSRALHITETVGLLVREEPESIIEVSLDLFREDSIKDIVIGLALAPASVQFSFHLVTDADLLVYSAPRHVDVRVDAV